MKFCEQFKGRGFDRVEVRLVLEDEDDDIFAGVFDWDGEKITSLDGDSYDPEMDVLEYENFKNEKEGVMNGLVIWVRDF